MTKHTPGPWAHGRNHRTTGTVEIRQHTGDVVGYATCARQGYGHVQSDAEALANASLMAAAPLLLEALQMQEMAEADAAAGRRKGYFDLARELRRAALAKAKGDTP